ncbi:MAG: hypothetical protein NT031_00040 [Planctomycetota bacterium]|nr:hypothetical protein [Planctomycetota bacterium]
MKRAALVTILLFSAGCPRPEPATPPPNPGPVMEPLALQQARIYPETATKRFVSLVDFEDSPTGPRGFKQVELFSISPARPAARTAFAVNLTRTGAGALDVLLPPDTNLVMNVPHIHDFTGYCLLALAMHVEAARDDLRVELTSDKASWKSHRVLLQPGWNNVLIDIRRLASEPGFDIHGVRQMKLSFEEAPEPVGFALDDVILIDNARFLAPVPPGFRLRKDGLDYQLTLPNPTHRADIRQGDDALWREGSLRPGLAVSAPGREPAVIGESLERLGARRVGEFVVLEHNLARLRLRNTWFFPTRGGEWLSMSVRRLAFEYTLWSDGRCVTSIELNNAGGLELGSLRLRSPAPGAWAELGERPEVLASPFRGPVGLWQYLLPPAVPRGAVIAANYLRPPPVEIALGLKDAFAPGDANRDRFDESQGCYVLAAAPGGHCRFSVTPGPEGLLNPAFRVLGPWRGSVSVQTAGRVIRHVGLTDDGSAVFVLEGLFSDPFPVEVAGDLASPKE